MKCVFIDTEKTKINTDGYGYVVYNLSVDVFEFSMNNLKNKEAFEKNLRSRTITRDGDGSILQPVNDGSLDVVFNETEHLIPHGYARFIGTPRMNFKQAMVEFATILRRHKPDIMFGFNYTSDLQHLRITQKYINVHTQSKTPLYILFMDHPQTRDDALFINCKEYDQMYKCDVYPFVAHKCPKFMDEYNVFARNIFNDTRYPSKTRNKFKTRHYNISKSLESLYSFVCDDPAYVQQHTAKGDNYMTKELLEFTMRRDPSVCKAFPMTLMSPLERNPLVTIKP